MFVRFFILCAIIIGLSGCATIKKETKEDQLNQFQTQICELQNQVKQKDEQINYLQNRVAEQEQLTSLINQRMRRESFKSKKKKRQEKISYEKDNKKNCEKTPENIQLALKNAGFYKGPINGKLGQKTRNAICRFQKSKRIKVDGAVGQKTWSCLKKYL